MAHFGVTLGHFGVTVASLWDDLGVLWARCGQTKATLGHLGAHGREPGLARASRGRPGQAGDGPGEPETRFSGDLGTFLKEIGRNIPGF